MVRMVVVVVSFSVFGFCDLLYLGVLVDVNCKDGVLFWKGVFFKVCGFVGGGFSLVGDDVLFYGVL